MSAVAETVAAWREIVALAEALARFLRPEHKRQLLGVSFLACVVSGLETLTAMATVPYVQCLLGQCPVALERTAGAAGIGVVPALSLGLFLLITIKLLFQGGLQWRQVLFTQKVQRDTVSQLFEGYVHLDWMVFRTQHQAHYLRRCATTAVDAAHVSHQCVVLISSGLMLVFLTSLMLWQYPVVSTILAAGFAAVSVLIQRLMGQAQKHAAHRREAALQRWNIGMAEAFASFREIRVYRLEGFFQGRLDQAVDALADANKMLNFFPILPRLVMDFAIFATLLLVVTTWLILDRPLAELLPLLVFYGIVARAILPAMMSLLSTRAVLYGSMVNIELVLGEFGQAAAARINAIGIEPVRAKQAGFALERVSFRHAPDAAPVLEEVSLAIPHPSWAALVGPSGAGKSTLMELLCGILVPQSGAVVHSWPAREYGRDAPGIAYIPQHVTLLDDSVTENVVFGFDSGEPARVKTALALACLSEVVDRLPGGVHARIGADGSGLSGGERQRLALARALYRRPDLLLLDEATSGLDEATETRLLSELRRERPDMTVIYITHRSNNLRFADQVVRLEGRRVQVLSPDRAPL
jgi:ABC-type multidrug transport system fused ATPase/permease subunit